MTACLRHRVALCRPEFTVKLIPSRYHAMGASNVNPSNVRTRLRVLAPPRVGANGIQVHRPNLNDPQIRELPIIALALAMAISTPGIPVKA